MIYKYNLLYHIKKVNPLQLLCILFFIFNFKIASDILHILFYYIFKIYKININEFKFRFLIINILSILEKFYFT